MSFRVVCLLTLALSLTVHGQDRGRRGEMEQSLMSRYRVTTVGSGFMRGSPDAIKHAGGVIILRHAGLYGSFERAKICSNAIRGDQIQILAGTKDRELMPGEEFYLNSVSVGSDVVALGLLSVRTLSKGTQSGRLWAAANFFFAPDKLERGDLGEINSVLDQWFASQEAAPVTVAATLAAPVASPAVQLKPGMSRDEIVSALGKPIHEVSFGDRAWLTYSALTAVLDHNALVFVDRSGQPPAKLSVVSEPSGADLYIDGKFVSSTPVTLPLPPGTYKVSVQSKGYKEWQRDLQLFSGAEINLRAQLEH